MRPTHVEFEQTNGVLHVVRREDVSLYRGESGEWSAFLADSDQPERISPETAARLRRELLGEPEAACRHEWDADGERCIHCGDKDWMGSVPSAPPPEPAPPVVTGPGPAAEPEFVLARLGVVCDAGWSSPTYHPDHRENAEAAAARYANGRVVLLFMRREDDRP